MSNTDKNSFKSRLDYMVRCITTGRTDSRRFSGCLMWNDDDFMLAALYRRSLNNPKLADRLYLVIRQESIVEAVEKLAHIPTSQLAVEAKRMQEQRRLG